MAFLSFRRSKPEPRGFCVPTLFFCASDCVVCNITEMCFHLSAAVSCPWITSSAQKDESRPTFHRENTVIRNRHTQSLGERTGTSLCCDSYFPELLSPGIFLLLMFLSNIKKRKKHVLNSQNGGEVTEKELDWMSLIWQLQLSWWAQLVTETFEGHLRTRKNEKQRWNSQVQACVWCAQRNAMTSCVRCKYQFYTLPENPLNCAPCAEPAKVGSNC